MRRPLAILGLLALVGLSLAAPALRGAQAQDGDVDRRVAAILDDAAHAPVAEVWARTQEIRTLGAAAAPALERALQATSPVVRLVAAKGVLDVGRGDSRDRAIAALRDLVTAPIEAALRIQACELLDLYARADADVSPLVPALASVREPLVRVALARLLQAKAHHEPALAALAELLASPDLDVRAAAALALGEARQVDTARAVLEELAREPTLRGRHAQALLSQDELYDELLEATEGQPEVRALEQRLADLEREVAAYQRRQAQQPGGQQAPGGGAALIEEIETNIRRFYDYRTPDEIEDAHLIDGAAHGLISILDPFSSYLAEEPAPEGSGPRGGIGAVVAVDPNDGFLTIIRAVHGGPAWGAGLRSQDKITSIEGDATPNRPIEEIVAALKGEPGTSVRLSVWRRGWPEARDFTIVRSATDFDPPVSLMLPGQIGYLAIPQFSEEVLGPVDRALADLQRQGMRALLLDLRANPGGLLTAAVDVADRFLTGEQLIVYSQGRNQEIAPRRDFRTHEAVENPAFPLYVLIDRSTASAAEILAGALAEHDRATLVGTRTLGRGTIQMLIPLDALNRQARLRLTVGRYFLPSGRSIHRTGVDPDVAVPETLAPSWIDDAAASLHDSGAFARYLDSFGPADQPLLRRLAWFDAGDGARWPAFREWVQTVGGELTEAQLLQAMRRELRHRLEVAGDAPLPCDIEEDRILRRGILAALTGLGDDPERYEETSGLAGEFVEGAGAAPETPGGTPGAGPR